MCWTARNSRTDTLFSLGIELHTLRIYNVSSGPRRTIDFLISFTKETVPRLFPPIVTVSPAERTTESVAKADEMVHSTPARIERARTIERADPKLAEKVISGEISKGRALKEIKARTATPTDPDRADDKVVDATAEAHADGYTKKMEAAWSAYWKLDETEQTAFHERQKQKGMV